MSETPAPTGRDQQVASGSATSAYRWVAMGDSFSAGTTPGERTWVTVAGEQLIHPQRKTEVINMARMGAGAGDVRREQLDRALTVRPDLILSLIHI